MNKKEKKEIRSEIDDSFYELGCIVKKVVIVCIFISIAMFLIGSVFGFAKKNIDRVAFKQSITYNENAAQFLSDQYYEYNKTDDISEKNAIKRYVIMRYPNLNTNNIENESIKSFYISCLRGE